MDNDHLKYSYSINRFANTEQCEQLLADTNILGAHWIKLTSEEEIPDSTRGIYLVSLVSPYKLASLDNTFSFRNTLYINKTEDIRAIFKIETLLSAEVLEQLNNVYEDVPFESLRDVELWFLPTPGVSMSFIDNLLTNLRNFFNPPYNPNTVKPIKARPVTNLSAPAF
jgi:hypothetical protein